MKLNLLDKNNDYKGSTDWTQNSMTETQNKNLKNKILEKKINSAKIILTVDVALLCSVEKGDIRHDFRNF